MLSLQRGRLAARSQNDHLPVHRRCWRWEVGTWWRCRWLRARPQNASQFTLCCCAEHQFGFHQALLAVGDGDLVALSLSDGRATETAHIKLDSEIACLDITPLGALRRH